MNIWGISLSFLDAFNTASPNLHWCRGRFFHYLQRTTWLLLVWQSSVQIHIHLNKLSMFFVFFWRLRHEFSFIIIHFISASSEKLLWVYVRANVIDKKQEIEYKSGPSGIPCIIRHCVDCLLDTRWFSIQIILHTIEIFLKSVGLYQPLNCLFGIVYIY